MRARPYRQDPWEPNKVPDEKRLEAGMRTVNREILQVRGCQVAQAFLDEFTIGGLGGGIRIRVAFKQQYRVEDGATESYSEGRLSLLGWLDFRMHVYSRVTDLELEYYRSHYGDEGGPTTSLPECYVLSNKEAEIVRERHDQINDHLRSLQGSDKFSNLFIRYVDLAKKTDDEYPGNDKALMGDPRFSLDQIHPSCLGQRWVMDRVMEALRASAPELPEEHPLHGYELPGLPNP